MRSSFAMFVYVTCPYHFHFVWCMLEAFNLSLPNRCATEWGRPGPSGILKGRTARIWFHAVSQDFTSRRFESGWWSHEFHVWFQALVGRIPDNFLFGGLNNFNMLQLLQPTKLHDSWTPISWPARVYWRLADEVLLAPAHHGLSFPHGAARSGNPIAEQPWCCVTKCRRLVRFVAGSWSCWILLFTFAAIGSQVWWINNN